MPAFSLNKIFRTTRGALLNARRRQRSEQQEKLESKKQEMLQLKKDLRAIKEQQEKTLEQRKRFKDKKREIRSKRREIFRLRHELRSAREHQAESVQNDGRPAPLVADEQETGALPDFVIIGAQKCGTTSLYRLLTRHPLVDRAALKELHFFDNLYDKGTEWYRRCFPAPRWKDGRRIITGEATPAYIFRPYVPERMAQVVPQARLIAVLRNPVDRAFSHYHKQVRMGRETLSFEEVIESGLHREYLSRGIYVDQLLRWSTFYPEEQILVLKSEDFFEYPWKTLKAVLSFLELPEWKPEAWEVRNKGGYEQEMAPKIRRQLEEYFEPHNERLYEHLGVDFGW